MKLKVVAIEAADPEFQSILTKLLGSWTSEADAPIDKWSDSIIANLRGPVDDRDMLVASIRLAEGKYIVVGSNRVHEGFLLRVEVYEEPAVAEPILVYKHEEHSELNLLDSKQALLLDRMNRAFHGHSCTEIYNKIVAEVPEDFWVDQETSGRSSDNTTITLHLGIKGSDAGGDAVFVKFTRID